jgi:hypothetical protein
MFQRIIRSFMHKEIIGPAGFVLALLIVLSVIIILGQFFHQSLQEEMAEQFNKQQQLLSRQIAINIESYVNRVYHEPPGPFRGRVDKPQSPEPGARHDHGARPQRQASL